MGQYYLCANLDKRLYLRCEEHLKLTEHAWMENEMVRDVECHLQTDWQGDRIVWAGDYMDAGLFVPEQDYCAEGPLRLTGVTVTVGRRSLYNYAMVRFRRAAKPAAKILIGEYLVNHGKRQFVDKSKCRESDGWIVHPLPILTCSGNGRGSGDYKPVNDHDKAYIGLWAGDSVSVGLEIPNGYEEIVPDFYEDMEQVF